MNNKIDNWRRRQEERQKERAKRDWHAYAWTNRWTDSLSRQTDRQMVLLLGKAGFDEMDKQTIRLSDRHINRQKLYWDALNGQTEK